MLDQTTTQLMGLIHNLQIYIHNIPCVATFVIYKTMYWTLTILCSFGRPWLRDTKVAHD
jgi:hypothetical protein